VAPPPPRRTGRRGRPPEKGDRLPSLAKLAATAAATTRYGKTTTISAATVTCLSGLTDCASGPVLVRPAEESETGQDPRATSADHGSARRSRVPKGAGPANAALGGG
jgi:hypothetical protein